MAGGDFFYKNHMRDDQIGSCDPKSQIINVGGNICDISQGQD